MGWGEKAGNYKEVGALATSDRLYEITCDCRDLETRLDRLSKDLQVKTELLEAFKQAAGELLESIDDARLSSESSLPAGVIGRASDLRYLIS